MTQPANKRFVMEDNFTTELALKAPKANPTFTGTVAASTINVDTLNASTTVNAANLDVGTVSGVHLDFGISSIAALNNTTGSSLSINSGGGSILLGNAAHLVNVLGNLTVNGNFTPSRGYMLVQRDVYTSTPAAFTKATYPWLRAIKVICVGGGGGGGGAALTGATQNAIGQSGGGGAYAETFITDIAGLAASETLTVGAAGTAGAAGGAGGIGGNTSFGTLCVAKGGINGAAGAATAVGTFIAGTVGTTTGSTGDVISPGGASGTRMHLAAASVVRPTVGGNCLFPFAQTAASTTTTTSAGVSPGANVYGVGGYAGINAQNQATAIAGGIGSGGIMIVELYA